MASTTATIKHRFQTAKANRTDVDVSATRWNDSEVMAGGSTGGLCVRDASQTDGWGLVDAVATGQLLVSAGVGTLPTWSASPTLSGHLLFSPDNTYDLGASGATRPRTGYFGTSITIGTNPANVGHVRLGNEAFIAFKTAGGTDIAGMYFTNSNWLVVGDTNVTLTKLAAGAAGFHLGSSPKSCYPAGDNDHSFGTPSLRWSSGYFGTSVSIGTNPATTGAIRLANNQSISVRNGANTADIAILNMDGSNGIYMMSPSGLAFTNPTFSAGWNVQTSNAANSAFYPSLDNQSDLAGSANRARNIYAGTSIVNTGYYEGTEMTAPAAPAADKGRLYFEDNGSGKTRLMVIFNTGAAQQIAIQP